MPIRPENHPADHLTGQTPDDRTDAPVTDDTTTARRQLLGLVLAGIENGTLPDSDRPLLRPLVEAEMTHGQAMIDQFTADAPWLKATAEDRAALQQRHQDLIAETRRQGDVHERTAQRAQQAEADRDRVAGVLNRVNELRFAWEKYDVLDLQATTMLAELVAAINGPDAAVRTPEPVFCSPLITTNCPGHTEPPYCDRAASRPETTTPAQAAPIEETSR